MELKAGYKQTRIGIIPVDWRVVTVDEISTVGRGRVISHKEIARSRDSRYPVYSSQTSDEGVMGYLDRYDFDGEYVTWTTDGENAGTVFARNGKFNCTNVCGTIKLRADNYLFVATALNRVTERHVSRHVGNPKLMNGVMKKVAFALPECREEQDAIATALGDVDALLAAQDALIAKKRAIKQGAMQELLTGKRRLPGFSGEWKEMLLGDVAHIKTGSRNNEDKVEDGDYPFFVRSEFIERIDGYSYDCEAILVPGEGKVGEIFHYINGRFDVHQRVYAITQFASGLSGRFVHLYLKMHFGPWAMQNTVKATVDSLRLPTFQDFKMHLPPTLDEQTAIVDVLSDMDAELAALEAQRAKTAQLKQGMMQALLTGRIRLV